MQTDAKKNEALAAKTAVEEEKIKLEKAKAELEAKLGSAEAKVKEVPTEYI